MSLPKTLPFRRPLGLAGSLPHLPEIKSAKPFDTAVNLALPSRIAVIGNYLPRQCGIATFTTDLCNAVSMKRYNASKESCGEAAEYGTICWLRSDNGSCATSTPPEKTKTCPFAFRPERTSLRKLRHS